MCMLDLFYSNAKVIGICNLSTYLKVNKIALKYINSHCNTQQYNKYLHNYPRGILRGVGCALDNFIKCFQYMPAKINFNLPLF